MQTHASHDEHDTIERHWHELKPGDTVYFATGWYEVVDAYLIGQSTALVKLRIAPGHVETHRVRIRPGAMATCLD